MVRRPAKIRTEGKLLRSQKEKISSKHFQHLVCRVSVIYNINFPFGNKYVEM
jgi:hypothetical protein